MPFCRLAGVSRPSAPLLPDSRLFCPLFPAILAAVVGQRRRLRLLGCWMDR